MTHSQVQEAMKNMCPNESYSYELNNQGILLWIKLAARDGGPTVNQVVNFVEEFKIF